MNFNELRLAVDALYFLISKLDCDESTKTVLKYCMSDVLDKINNFDYECEHL